MCSVIKGQVQQFLTMYSVIIGQGQQFLAMYSVIIGQRQQFLAMYSGHYRAGTAVPGHVFWSL